MKFKLSHFDLDRFLGDEQLPLLEIDNMATIIKASKILAEEPQMVAIVAPAGYGVSTALNHITKAIRRDVLNFELKPSVTLKTVLIAWMNICGYGDSKYHFNNSSDTDLVRALAYHLNSSPKTSKGLIIIDGLGHWKRRSILLFDEFIQLVIENTGCIFSINPKSLAVLEKLALKDEMIHTFIENVDEWIYPDRPSVHEMNSICFEAGILNQALIDEVITDCTNLNLLNKRVKRLRRHLKKVIEGGD